MSKAKDLRDQSVAELEAVYQDTRKQLFVLVNELKRTKKIEKPHLLQQKRKEIARVLTIISEKQAAEQSIG